MALCERVSFLKDLCRGRRVLHLGCADWPYTKERLASGRLLHSAIESVAKSQIGVDLSQEGVELLRKFAPAWDVRCVDANSFVPDFEYDIILCSELIEHMENPGLLLRSIRKWAHCNSQLVLTTPNAYALKASLRALAGREFCHPDHTVVFSSKTLQQLLKKCGWDTTQTAYYHLSGHSTISRMLSGTVWLLNFICSDRMGDGLIVVARTDNPGPEA
ncbi:MAG: class I SAM-dependent methyltransferase [Planctomycetes bacterium]|nr:class I SAM-dependent methyltransferase [Planctomycetota bacterium]